MSKNTVTQQHIDAIWKDSEVFQSTMFDKCTIVAVQLPNGFVIVESSACVDPANYDENVGYEICVERIKNKIWELEGYKLQSEIADQHKQLGFDFDDDYYPCGCCTCCGCDCE